MIRNFLKPISPCAVRYAILTSETWPPSSFRGDVRKAVEHILRFVNYFYDLSGFFYLGTDFLPCRRVVIHPLPRHRVDRLLCFFSSHPIGTPPPHPQASVSLPSVPGGDTLACRRRGGGVPVRTRRQTLCNRGASLWIRTVLLLYI